MPALVLAAFSQRNYATDSPRPVWWAEISDAATQTCLSFLRHDTDVDGILKLGACWGGWNCVNPSYIHLSAYRACRDWTATQYRAQWNALIATSSAILQGAQCPTTGLLPNWYVPNRAAPAMPGTTGCSGSGTPADQFGAEAARSMWRAALDWTLYRSAESAAFSQRAVLQVRARWPNWSTALDTGCLVQSVFSDWSNNAFIFAPLFSSLVVPTPAITVQLQSTVFADAMRRIAATPINSYYSGSWIALTTLVMSGDMQRAACAVGGDMAAGCVTESTTTTVGLSTTSTISTSVTAPTASTSTAATTTGTTLTTSSLTTQSPTTTTSVFTTSPVSSCSPLNITAAFRSTWPGGYTLDITLRNVSPTVAITNWAVRVNIGTSTLAPPVWNSIVLSNDSAGLVLGAPTWMQSLAPAASIAMGFNGNGDAAQVRVRVIDYRFSGSSVWQQCATA